MENSTLQLFPALAAPVEAALRASIERFGVLVPVAQDRQGRTIDGHHRARLADELGIPYRIDVFDVEDDAEALEIARTLNADRRHLTPEQVREVATELREQGHSLRAIAGAVGMSHEAVRSVVNSLTPESRIVGIDGKSYPSFRQPVEEPSPPHVAHNSGENEWYTPKEYIEAARTVLGAIDLDPATSAQANRVVMATTAYTIEDDGLMQDWAGRVWMNPPYAGELVGLFTAKLTGHYLCGEVPAAIVLVNNATETQWFQGLAKVAAAICFPERRVRFWNPDGESSAPLQGQAFVYLGNEPDAFCATFKSIGLVVWVANG